MTRFVHVLVNLQHEHDLLLHVDDDEFDNQSIFQDFHGFYRLWIQSKKMRQLNLIQKSAK
jgi:hypothetical protein